MRGGRYTTQAKLDARVRRVRLARRRVALLTRVALVGGVIELAAMALTSPHLAVKHVQVSGASLETSPWTYSTLRTALGDNILRAPVSELRKRLESHPVVEKAKVRRTLPSGLAAEITERTPYASVVWKSGCYTVDRGLVPFRNTASPESGLPVIEALSAGAPTLGRRWESTYLEAGMQCLRAAGKSDLKVAKVSIDPVGDMCLNIGNGTEIRAGYPQDIEQKMTVASRVLASLPVPPGSIQYVDVSCPSAPAYRPRGGGESSPVP